MSHRISPILLSLVLLSVQSVPVPAQDNDTPQPATACTGEGFRAFDFWVGEWNVYGNQNGNFAGTNTIEPDEGGCLLRETWVSASSGGGSSINYYNPLVDEWRQVWHSAGGGGYSIDYTGGLNSDGAMELEGEIYYYAREAAFPFRGLWTPNEDGTVRQQFWQYNPETEEWAVWFDGLYVRQSEDTRQD